VRWQYFWSKRSSSLLGICCLDKCPAAEERTLLSSKLELDLERLSNPCFTELDRIATILEKLAYEDDVRRIIRKIIKNN
jgi:hypothetical protein